MPSLQSLRRKIASVKNTQKITKAMKMVAAAKLKRAQDRILSARPYAHELRDVVRSPCGTDEPDLASSVAQTRGTQNRIARDHE